MIEKTAKAFLNAGLETPAYIFDIDILKKHLNELKNELVPFKLCYAMKANPLLTDIIEPFVDRIEVCSEGEFEICKVLGIPASKIFYTGVLKSEQGVKDACEYGVELFNVESLDQLKIILNFNKNAKLFLRLSSGNQFGMDEQTLSGILKDFSDNVIGLHYFAGTFRDKKRHFDIEKLQDFLNHYKFNELEYGAGLGAAYFQNEQNVDIKAFKSQIESFGIPVCVELGRYIVACCGLYASKICDVKTNDNINYAILDGGMNHLNYYGQMMGMKIPRILHFGDSNEYKEWTLCGPICSTNDVIVKNSAFNGLKQDDILFFANSGAYSSTEASYLFLSRAMPNIYLYEKEKFHLAREIKNTYNLNLKEKK